MNSSRSDSQNIDDLLKAFAAIAHGGLILMIGESTLAYQRSILSGMDAMTRLVINLPPNTSAMDIEESLDSDLRVAVHQQNPEEFLSDISHHTLNLVVLGYKEISVHLIRQIYTMLFEGGSVILLRSSQSLNAEIDEELCAFHSTDIGSCKLLVKKSQQASKIRKGGRRARLAASD